LKISVRDENVFLRLGVNVKSQSIQHIYSSRQNALKIDYQAE